MDQLFAPWRIDWVAREAPPDEREGCVFCDFAGVEADREHLVVARGESVYVVLNNYPYNPGHVMVVPHTHIGDFQGLERAVLHEVADVTQATLAALRTAFDPDGFNIGYNLGSAAGGSIGDHVHRHVVPRWSGDSNFMAVVGETKVIVQALEDSYDALHDAFGTLPGTAVEGEGAAVDLGGMEP